MHSHSFHLLDTLTGRYRCSGCPVLAYRLGSRLVPFACRAEVGERRVCSKPAVYVDGQRSHSRCAEHVERRAA